MIDVLLVEDNPADISLTREAFSDGKLIADLNVVEDGEQALAYLRRQGKYANTRLPDLILLDLNLPRIDGREVLREIKSDRALRAIPVIVLTTSEEDVDVLKTYGMGANSYITKPVAFEKFVDVVASIEDFWFTVVRLPSSELMEQYARNFEQAVATSSQPPLSGFEDRIFNRIVRVLSIGPKAEDMEDISRELSGNPEVTFSFSRARSLEEGIRLMSEKPFSVVLLDLEFVDGQGLEAVRAVLAEHPHMPVVILAQEDDTAVALQAIRQGAQSYLVKGQVNAALLARVIEYSMERKWLETERDKALAEARDAQAEAEHAVWLRDQFLSIASHELKTPMTSLMLQTGVLLRNLERMGKQNSDLENVRRLLARYERETLRLKWLVDSLLDVSKINAGRLAIQADQLDLPKLLQEVVLRFENQALVYHTPIRTQAPGSLLVHWDAFRIEQVLVNLISNAIRYGAHRPVDVEILDEGEWVRIVVKDQGIGIDKEDQEKIFHRFERAAAHEKYGGFGLGLYITRQIVNAHQGRIRVESEPGRGSSFIVELPVEPVLGNRKAA